MDDRTRRTNVLPHADAVRALHDALARVPALPLARRLDADWLRLRCEDTLAMAGELRDDSLRHLSREVLELIAEHRGLLSDSLVAPFAEATAADAPPTDPGPACRH